MFDRSTLSELLAAYRQDREEEVLDMVVTAAALVARADGRVKPVERGLLVDFLDRLGFLEVFTYRQIIDAFERRVHQLAEPGATVAAIKRLRQEAGPSLARLLIDVARQVAAADRHHHPSERRMLKLIRNSVTADLIDSAPGRE